MELKHKTPTQATLVVALIIRLILVAVVKKEITAQPGL
jgi:hypothetical protein